MSYHNLPVSVVSFGCALAHYVSLKLTRPQLWGTFASQCGLLQLFFGRDSFSNHSCFAYAASACKLRSLSAAHNPGNLSSMWA